MWWVTTSNQEMKNAQWAIAMETKKKRTWRVAEKEEKNVVNNNKGWGKENFKLKRKKHNK